MSEEKTQDMSDGRSFEERVFARFDDMDRRFDGLEARVQRLEEQSERRAAETKPIWERALGEILAVQQRLDRVEERLDKVEAALKDLARKIEVISLDMMQLRANMRDHETRLERLESETAG